mmetsp:Transcript_24218/g.81675  ORF Transcript_24218/g.81675 Transcript_24218/m.81675 type:complete len:204 (-) Transcript_24218:467-1078(-)
MARFHCDSAEPAPGRLQAGVAARLPARFHAGQCARMAAGSQNAARPVAELFESDFADRVEHVLCTEDLHQSFQVCLRRAEEVLCDLQSDVFVSTAVQEEYSAAFLAKRGDARSRPEAFRLEIGAAARRSGDGSRAGNDRVVGDGFLEGGPHDAPAPRKPHDDDRRAWKPLLQEAERGARVFDAALEHVQTAQPRARDGRPVDK